MKEREKENEFARRFRDALVMLDDEKRLRVRLEMENRSLRDSLMEKSQALEAVEKKLTETLEALHTAKEELAEHRSIEEELAEFDQKLTKVEEMKQRYEKRIALLENQLQTAETRLKSLKITMYESEVIDIGEETPPPLGEAQKIKVRPHAEAPATVQVQPKSVDKIKQTERSDKISEGFDNTSDSTDWLMDLPDF